MRRLLAGFSHPFQRNFNQGLFTQGHLRPVALSVLSMPSFLPVSLVSLKPLRLALLDRLSWPSGTIVKWPPSNGAAWGTNHRHYFTPAFFNWQLGEAEVLKTRREMLAGQTGGQDMKNFDFLIVLALRTQSIVAACSVSDSLRPHGL